MPILIPWHANVKCTDTEDLLDSPLLIRMHACRILDNFSASLFPSRLSSLHSSARSPTIDTGTKMALTFDLEDGLPSLPLPPLGQSLQNYLSSVKAVVTEDEYKKTEEIVKNFQETIGPKLHENLQQRAETKRNWLEEWWERYAYLQSRSPIAAINGATTMDGVNMNNWPARPGTQLLRASQATWVAAKYFLKLRREEESIDTDPNGNPISMHQLRSLFSSCREPGEDCDRMMRYFQTEREGLCPNHVVVFCNGHIYRMEVFDRHENLYGSKEIMRQLADIKRRSEAWRGQCIGVITAATRDAWARAYNHMCSLSRQNQKHFETIRSAIFGLCLDSESPSNIQEAMSAGMSGTNVQDRWFDKAHINIVFESGMLISTTDHTAFDGFAAFKLALHNQREFQAAPIGYMGNTEIHESRAMPEELVFVTDPLIEEYKQLALTTYQENASSIDLMGTHIECSRSLVKKNGISPDAFMQMAIQLAYFTKYRKPATCYETGSTVMFFHGRTDTIRTCTTEMVDWCIAMEDDSKTKDEKIHLMRAVNAKHRELTIQAVTGQAFDRHLMGLYITAVETGVDIPEIFLDETYAKSGGGGNFTLSTSQLGRFYQFGAVAPMVKDGYSVFYNILEERYFIIVVTYKTCPHTDSMDFLDRIRRSVLTMKHLLKESAKL